MAEYIKREMPDMNGNGERKAYYQVRSYSNLSSDESPFFHIPQQPMN